MQKSTLRELSQRLIKIIETRDYEKVKYWTQVLERQKDPMVNVEIFILISRYLSAKDEDLNDWFQNIYFEAYKPEVKKMWLDFIDLCSLSVA